jgi:hypothetical protein
LYLEVLKQFNPISVLMKTLIAILLSVFGFVGSALSAETLEAIRARIAKAEAEKVDTTLSSPVTKTENRQQNGN